VKVSSRELKFPGNTVKTASLFKMAAKQALKENLQCTFKYGHLRISQDSCHVRMTDIEGFLTIYGHSDNLLNNNIKYPARPRGITVKYTLMNTVAGLTAVFNVWVYIGFPCLIIKE